MKIAEVRKIYNKDPQTIFGALLPDKAGYVSNDDLEARKVPKSYSHRVKIVSLQKYYYNYWDLGRTLYQDLATARSSITAVADSEKSFGYLCEIYDDNNKPTGTFRVLSSRATFIGEITPELEHYWANEHAYRVKAEAEMSQRQAIVENAKSRADKQADQLTKSIRVSTIQVLTEAGLPNVLPQIYIRGDVEILDTKQDWRNLNQPFDQSHIKPSIRGKVELDYLEFQRLLEIVYEAKARL